MKHGRIEQAAALEGELVITATEFKAKCLEILDRVKRGELKRVKVTKRGEPVADVTAPHSQTDTVPKRDRFDELYGRMKGTFTLPPDLDLTKPIFEGRFDDETGEWKF